MNRKIQADSTDILATGLTSCCTAKPSRDYDDNDGGYNIFCTACRIEIGYGKHSASYYGIRILQSN